MNKNHSRLVLDIPEFEEYPDSHSVDSPAMVQPHGMLIAARVSDMRIVYTSENSVMVLGVTPQFLFDRTLPEILGQETMGVITEALGAERYRPATILTCRFPICGDTLFDVSAHRTDGVLSVELGIAREIRRWDLFSTRLEQAVRELGRPHTLEILCATVPALIRKLTGFDRVMIYRCDGPIGGKVVGEETSPGMEPLLGLHYNAQDLPRRTGRPYVREHLRTVVDVGARTVKVIGHPDLALGVPLNMIYSDLRAPDAAQIVSLKAMGVCARLGMSLVHGDELWGMVICHHRTSRQVPPELKSICEILGQLISLHVGGTLQTQYYSERLVKKALLDRLRPLLEGETSIGSALSEAAEVVLALVGANGALIRIGDEKLLIGRTPVLAEAESLMLAMQVNCVDGAAHADKTGTLLPAFAHLGDTARGALVVRFDDAGDGIAWFRGDGAEQSLPDETVRTPRPPNAFASKESQQGRSPEWRPIEVETARNLCDIVTRAILQRTEVKLTRLLQDNALRAVAEKTLRSSEKRYRQMADSMPQIVWTAHPDGMIDYFNERWYDFTLFARNGDGSIDQLLHPDDVEPSREAWDRAVGTGEPYIIEHRLWDRGRKEFRWHLARALHVRDASGNIAKWFGTCTDIDDHKRLSDELEARVVQRTSDLQQSLVEKTILLKEVHHRVKNNLQVVSSLLSLQIGCQTDSPALGELREASERIHSMSLVHEQLYQSESLSDLDFGTYVESLAHHLYESYCPDTRRIRLALQTEPVPLTIDQAIPCGLILNELVSNSLKHAFKHDRSGLLTIRFARADDNNVELMVQDDGVGLGADFDLESTSSMGVQVLRALTSQLRASMSISKEGGAGFTLRWPLPAGVPRLLPLAATAA